MWKVTMKTRNGKTLVKVTKGKTEQEIEFDDLRDAWSFAKHIKGL